MNDQFNGLFVVYLTGITPLPADAIEYEDMLINLDIYFPHMQYRRFTEQPTFRFDSMISETAYLASSDSFFR